MFSDAVTYLFMADFFSPWLAHSELAADFYREARFPPGFPVFMGLMGIGSTNIGAAHLLIAILTIAAVALSALWAYRLTRSPVAALACGLAMCFSPLMLVPAVEIGSEAPFIALSMAVLLATNRLEPRPASLRDLGPGLLALACVLTRDIGLALLPALALWSFRRRSRWGGMGVLLAAAAYAAWRLLRSAYAVEGEYLGDLSRILGPTELPQLLAAAGEGIVAVIRNGWLAGSTLTSNRWVEIAAALLLAFAVPSFVAGLRAARPDAVYAVFYAGVLSIWPYPDEAPRLVAPLLPVFLAMACHSVSSLQSMPRRGRLAATAALAVTILVLCAVEAPRTIRRIALSVPDEMEPYVASRTLFEAATASDAQRSAESRLRLALLSQTLATEFGRQDRICAIFSDFATLQSRRVVLRLPLPLASATPVSEWAVANCDYLLVGAFAAPGANVEAFYPVPRLTTPFETVMVTALDEPEGADANQGVVAAIVRLRK